MEYLNLFNGNNQGFQIELPKLVIIADQINDVALAHVAANTGLHFEKKWSYYYEAQPNTANQIAALLLTYNFKTRYYNNSDFKNQLHLKLDHHTGFDVDSICFGCVKRNNIRTNNLTEGDFLAC